MSIIANKISVLGMEKYFSDSKSHILNAYYFQTADGSPFIGSCQDTWNKEINPDSLSLIRN